MKNSVTMNAMAFKSMILAAQGFSGSHAKIQLIPQDGEFVKARVSNAFGHIEMMIAVTQSQLEESLSMTIPSMLADGENQMIIIGKEGRRTTVSFVGSGTSVSFFC